MQVVWEDALETSQDLYIRLLIEALPTAGILNK